MRISEMSIRQKRAYYNIVNVSNYLIGGAENTMLDYAPDTQEYADAKAFLEDHDRLVKSIYREAVTQCYPGDDPYTLGLRPDSFLRDIRFCGKEWLMERVELRVRKMGY